MSSNVRLPRGAGRLLLVCALAVGFAQCAGSKTPTGPSAKVTATVTGIAVGVSGNAAALVAPGAKLQLWAVANYTDGTSVDVTNAAFWQSSNPAVATVSREGLLTAAAEGAVDVKASVDKISGSLHADIRRAGCAAAMLSASTIVYGPFGNYGSVTVTTPSSDCRWTANSDADWLRLNGRDRTTYDPGQSGSGTMQFQVLPNNYPDARSGNINIGFSDGGRLAVSISQEHPASCSFVATPDDGYFSAAGGTGRFEVTATPADCRWTATANYSFYGIRLTSASNGTGRAQVSYSVDPSAQGYARDGYVEIDGLSGANPSAIHKIHIAAR